MFEKSFETVIGLDTDRGEIHFFHAKKGDKAAIRYFAAPCKAQLMSKEFFEKIGEAVDKFRETHPDCSMQRVSLVVSDAAAITDTLNLPIINKKAMDTSLEASLTNLYGEGKIRFNHVLAMQNKQFATYAVAGMRKELLVKLQDVFASHQVGVANVTFAAAATANCAMVLNPKLKNASFLVLDLKENFSRFVFTVNGRTLGFYSLPFGTDLLHSPTVAAEDMLFDHGAAELVVLNASEKAKAKALTRADAYLTVAAEEDEEEEAEPAEASAEAAAATDAPAEGAQDTDGEESAEGAEDDPTAAAATAPQGKARKRTPRNLPKYMQRPVPETAEGVAAENFRIFVKWTLELIAANAPITALGAPEAVYVNMPHKYDFLYELVNAEAEENGIRFLPLSDEPSEVIRTNTELYGALFAKQYNKINCFHASQLDSFTQKKADKPQARGGAAAGEKKTSFTDKLKRLWELMNTPIGGK